MFVFKLLATLAVAGFPLMAEAQTPACLLAVVNQAIDPSDLSAICASNIVNQISNVCHGSNIAAASSAFSSICGAAATVTAALTPAANTADNSATPFASRASTPALTGGFTTMAGTPTYAPLGPVAFNTLQAPTTPPAASHIYHPAITSAALTPAPATPSAFKPAAVYIGEGASLDGKAWTAIFAAVGAALLLL